MAGKTGIIKLDARELVPSFNGWLIEVLKRQCVEWLSAGPTCSSRCTWVRPSEPRGGAPVHSAGLPLPQESLLGRCDLVVHVAALSPYHPPFKMNTQPPLEAGRKPQGKSSVVLAEELHTCGLQGRL